jgi:hypothetical protein
MVECPTCKGTKKQSWELIKACSDNRPKSIKIICRTCDGKGDVPLHVALAIQAKKDVWCKCESNHGSRYVPSNSSVQISKSHWACLACEKAVKIGDSMYIHAFKDESGDFVSFEMKTKDVEKLLYNLFRAENYLGRVDGEFPFGALITELCNALEMDEQKIRKSLNG